MNLDQLKSGWTASNQDVVKQVELKKMLSENRHPVLKGIRMQLLFESITWIIFLGIYYDGLDGHQKPLYANLLLVAAVLLLLVHSIAGYLAAKKVIRGNNLYDSLLAYQSKLKRYSIFSVGSRVLMVGCLLLFFVSNIQMTDHKWFIIAAMVLTIPVQSWMLSRIWNDRVRKIELTLQALKEE